MAIYFLGIFFVSIRLLTFLITMPAFFPSGTPNIFKVALSLIISYMILPGIEYSLVSDLAVNWYGVMSIALNETMTGLFLGFVTSLAFNAISMAGALIDFQIGLSMLSAFDPNSKKSSTLVERLMFFSSIVIFFIVDGHHILLKALMESFQVVGLGKSIVFSDTIMTVAESFIKYFVIGLKIAIPIVLIIIITELTMGLVSRTVPQLNIMILGLPVKILVGLTAFTFALPMIIRAMEHAIEGIPNIVKELYKFIPLVFIFSDEKTEEATPKKLSDARKKGEVAKSKEVSLALTLMTSTLILLVLGSYVFKQFSESLTFSLTNGFQGEIDYLSVRKKFLKAILDFMKIYLPIAVPIMVMGVFSHFVQTGFMLTSKPLKPSLSKLNPLNGFKRMFSLKSLVELSKNLLVIIIVGYVGYDFIKSNYVLILDTINININGVLPKLMKLIVSIFFRVTLVSIVIALVDFVYQKLSYKKEMKMTKQEIKDEYKQAEGDPQIKSRIRQKQREIISKRMMQAVPDATVIVTNPTHLAIALKYEEGGESAPKVIAKGKDNIALRIKEKAKEHNVPILENKPLARLIYEKVDIDKEIPEDMYVAVAEVLAVVYKLNKKK
ncbi:fused FliR family export protein/FlhB family type III secretion system protein [Clostridium hydrogeniformans]|uniref:fused FliR family export protein/FlhB family type III secretion system protein n=1 Tax=Clostridium hydrogeniformans TaxID=349933 RepID=UPI00048662DE|nr:fused FliR family export protein/FlhB family type III secretion system protein [Clostridium hydrogeniformans]